MSVRIPQNRTQWRWLPISAGIHSTTDAARKAGLTLKDTRALFAGKLTLTPEQQVRVATAWTLEEAR